jgi:hypothetical protein
VNIASILLTWCYIPIIHSLIDLPNILTVPTWFSYPCSEYSTNTVHLMLHTNHHSLIDLPNILTVPTWFSYPCSEHSTNTAHLMLHTNHSLTQTYPTFLLYLHGLVILVVNIAPILPTWCCIPIITHSDLPNILTVPTWFSYPTFLLYLHDLVILVVNIAPILLTWCYIPIIHLLRLTQHSYCTYMV